MEDRGLLRGRHRSLAAHRRGQRRGGPGDRPRDPAADAAIRARRDPGPLPRRLRHRRAAVPALRHARSGQPGRATTTGRHTGVRDVNAEAHRPQGRGPDRSGQHARVVRRRAGGRRGHDRVRHPRARGPAAARPRLRARRGRADARGGPRPPRLAAVRGRRARRRSQAPRLRGAGAERAARVRAGRAHARLDDVDALAGHPARAGAVAAARLVGAAPEERPDAASADEASRLRRGRSTCAPSSRTRPRRT